MNFPQLEMTDAGRAVAVNALAGGSIVFTKIGVGNGAKPSDIGAMTSLVNQIKSIGIGEITKGEGCVNLTAILDNANLANGFWWRELGVFAKDENNNEILYAYSNADSLADYIPAYSSTSYLRTTMNITVIVSDTENASAIISEYIGYVSTETFEGHTNNNNNPHSVTKSQVGLGNVPNVATNDQTPTFSATYSQIENIQSGEKVSTLFAKIKNAISGLIRHISADNPHEITCQKINAATSSHVHSANDITSGVLDVSRGGTGYESLKDMMNGLGLSDMQLSVHSHLPSQGVFLFENGLEISWCNTTVNIAEGEEYGYTTIAFSDAFTAPPFVFTTVRSSRPNKRNASVANITTTSCEVFISNSDKTVASIGVSVLIIGYR